MRFTKEEVYIMSIEDLLDYNKRTHDIEVDTYYVDMDFEPRKTVYIRFEEDEEGIVREYEMVSEDYRGIVLSYMLEYEDCDI